jgi:hypothetical protein
MSLQRLQELQTNPRILKNILERKPRHPPLTQADAKALERKIQDPNVMEILH